MSRIKTYLLLSQASQLVLLLICCLIIPSVVVKNGGISNFGNHRQTIVLYILSFSLCIIFLSLAAHKLRLKKQPTFATTLIIMSILEFLVLISTFPRHINLRFSELHDYLGIVLFSYQLGMSVWIVAHLRQLSSCLMLALEVIGSSVGLLSIIKIIHFLFIGQIVGALGFALLLVDGLPKVIKSRLKKAI